MKTAVIIHGSPTKKEYFTRKKPSQSNKHWLSWIQKELNLKGILAQTPEFPEPYKPVYEKWCSVFEQFKIDENTMLIGHSCGGGFLVRWLSENKVKVGNVVLVAPWIDPNHYLKTNFFDFKIDPNLAKRTKKLIIFESNNDFKEIQKSIDILRTKLKGANFKKFKNMGHFISSSMKTDKFPELLKELIK
ncbi:MAG: alpha/beta hydrolase [Candidatus Paceibacterota bacterium]|jgi:hypothetical protein